MLNKAQNPNYKEGVVLAFKHLGFNCHLDFDICVWLRAGLVPARIVPAHEAEMNSATTLIR